MPDTTPPEHYIVYADDDKDDVELLKECFDKHAQDVELITFENGHEVHSFLSSIPYSEPGPCLIILDINMPLMNGREVVQKLRGTRKYEDVPIVLFTTSSQPHDKIFARQYNTGFITKPLNYRQMDVIAENFIGHCADEIRNKIRKINSPGSPS